MWNNRAEGERHKSGINYLRTPKGHALELMIKFPNDGRLIVGYYWGIGWNWRFRMWNQKQEDSLTELFEKTTWCEACEDLKAQV